MTTLDAADRALAPGRPADRLDWRSDAARRQRARRYAADRRLKFVGLGAIVLAIGFLGLLIASMVVTGAPAFTETRIAVPVTVDPQEIPADAPASGDFRALLRDSVRALLPGAEGAAERALLSLPTNNALFLLRDRIVADPSLIGRTFTFEVPVADPIDQLAKGYVNRDLPANQRPRGLSDETIRVFDTLKANGFITSGFNWGLFFDADSRFPELAGLKGGIIGSFYLLLVTVVLSVPIGVAAAVYLEEFAPKNRFTDLIEVNINNLAAVPSVVFGLLALAVFLGWFGMPRSAPLVGGMTLALMTLPTIIIATRATLKSVPPSIREAALGIGASKHQVVLHHVLPLAIPGILTGTIIGLAQALGETAPLLLIGMNAFITQAPEGLLSASTTLPTQVFTWADSPERGFTALTSAGILVLLGFLLLMNGLAVIMRQTREVRW